MRVRLYYRNLPSYKKEYLKADFDYLIAFSKFQVLDSIEKLKQNRGFTFKLLNLLKKYAKVTSIDAFLNNLEILASVKFIDYKYRDNGKEVIIDLFIDDAYFNITEMIRKTDRLLGWVLYSKEKLLNRIRNESMKTYTRDFDYEIIEDVKPLF